MKTFATLLVCPLAALGAAILPRQMSVPEGPWTAGVWRQDYTSDVFFVGDAINANGGKFWVNRETSAYCPDGIEGLDCTQLPGTSTVFTGGNGTLSLNVAVPGGQQVYIAPDGSLSYTEPHSASMPDGSVSTGFSRQRSESFGAPVNVFNSIMEGWVACPVTEGEPRERTYQLFAGLQKEGCYDTAVRSYTSEGPNAWEYV
ncbi:hypothetical protein SLS62_000973 [Diatrype stigma]|uniref:Uncharacterized protein n=1 Tax=Diatrype stigma TaxID=117547 RepID=A0AAN9V0V6_9PEZI